MFLAREAIFLLIGIFVGTIITNADNKWYIIKQDASKDKIAAYYNEAHAQKLLC